MGGVGIDLRDIEENAGGPESGEVKPGVPGSARNLASRKLEML